MISMEIGEKQNSDEVCQILSYLSSGVSQVTTI